MTNPYANETKTGTPDWRPRDPNQRPLPAAPKPAAPEGTTGWFPTAWRKKR